MKCNLTCRGNLKRWVFNRVCLLEPSASPHAGTSEVIFPSKLISALLTIHHCAVYISARCCNAAYFFFFFFFCLLRSVGYFGCGVSYGLLCRNFMCAGSDGRGSPDFVLLLFHCCSFTINASSRKRERDWFCPQNTWWWWWIDSH